MEFGPSIHFTTPKRGKAPEAPFKRDGAVLELLKHRKLAQKPIINQDFYLNQFSEMCAAGALQDPPSTVRFYTFLGSIEGAKSCVFFAHPQLVFIADRVLGMESNFKNDRSLIKRVNEALNQAISNEMAHLISKNDLIDVSKKEKIFNRLINASLVHLRFLLRLKIWGFNDSKDLVESIAKIYVAWADFGELKSNFGLVEDAVGKVNLLLWSCVNSWKLFGDHDSFFEEFINVLLASKNSDAAVEKSENSLIKSAEGPKIAIEALVSYRYFIAMAYMKQMAPSKTFDLITKISQNLRNIPKLRSYNSAEIASKLISRQLINYLDDTGKTNWEKD